MSTDPGGDAPDHFISDRFAEFKPSLDRIEVLLKRLVEIAEADSPSCKDERMSAAARSYNAGAPKIFKACGHPFPPVSVMMGEGVVYEQRYTCEQCGATELYP